MPNDERLESAVQEIANRETLIGMVRDLTDDAKFVIVAADKGDVAIYSGAGTSRITLIGLVEWARNYVRDLTSFENMQAIDDANE